MFILMKECVPLANDNLFSIGQISYLYQQQTFGFNKLIFGQTCYKSAPIYTTLWVWCETDFSREEQRK